MSLLRRLVFPLVLAMPAIEPLGAERPPAEGLVAEPEAELKDGQFTWHPERAPRGPIVVVVSLPQQMAYVYRNGVRIARTTVSSGKPGHSTPTGVFHILEKDKDHRSSKYNNAPMPFTQRLTWDGICLHAGGLPGYPSSHGCVHLPYEFSRLLFAETGKGTTVIVTGRSRDPIHVMPDTVPIRAEKDDGFFRDGEMDFQWANDGPTEGPVSIVLSTRDERMYVYRNGVPVGESDVGLAGAARRVAGTHAFMMMDAFSDKPNPFAPGKPMPVWMHVGVEGRQAALEDAAHFADHLRVPHEFAEDVYRILGPGTTLVITDEAVTDETRSSPGFTILAPDEATDEVRATARSRVKRPPSK